MQPLRTEYVAAGSVLAVPSGRSSAAQQVPNVDLEVDAGIAGFFARGRTIPVRVALRSRTALTGVLTVEAEDSESPFALRRRVELAAGAVAFFTMVVPTDPADTFLDLSISMWADNGSLLATDAATVRADDSVELVAVLPQLAIEADPPAMASLVADVGVARLHRVDLALFGDGRRGVEIFDILAATGADLEALATDELAALHRWVLGGGALLIDEPVDATISGLPDEWSLGARGHGSVGQGEVMLTNGRLSTGAWSEVLMPQPTSNRFDEGDLGAFFVSFVEPTETTLARDARLELPGIGLLVGGSLLYSFVVAATLVGLGRARRHLMWILMPAFAITAAALVVAVGWRARAEERTVHGTIRETSSAGGWATTRALSVTSERLAEVALPRGWGATGDAVAGSARSFEEDDRLAVQLAPGAVASVVAEGPVGIEELSVEVRSTGAGGVVGTVTNNTPWDIDQAAVFATQQVVSIGAVPSGASAAFAIAGLNQYVPLRDREGLAWGERDSAVGEPTLASFDPDGQRNDGAWRDFVEDRGTNFWSPGSVVAVGWTTQAPMPLQPVRNTESEGRTAVVGRGIIRPGVERLDGTEITRRLVRGPQLVKVDFDGADRFGQMATAVHRFVVPDEVDGRIVDPADLVIEIPVSTVRADVWADGAWQPIRATRRDQAVVGLPPGSLIGNSVIVRFDKIFSMDTREENEFSISER